MGLKKRKHTTERERERESVLDLRRESLDDIDRAFTQNSRMIEPAGRRCLIMVA